MRAEEEGLPAAACLFRVVARAESVHAAKEAAVIEREFEGTPSSRREDAIVLGTAENLRTSIECEKFELGIVYPMIERCLRQMNKYEGLWRCSRARCAEATHACAFALALRALGGGTRREDCTATYAVTGQDPPRLPDQWYLCLGCGTVSAEPMICDNCGNLSLSVVAAACER